MFLYYNRYLKLRYFVRECRERFQFTLLTNDIDRDDIPSQYSFAIESLSPISLTLQVGLGRFHSAAEPAPDSIHSSLGSTQFIIKLLFRQFFIRIREQLPGNTNIVIRLFADVDNRLPGWLRKALCKHFAEQFHNLLFGCPGNSWTVQQKVYIWSAGLPCV